MNQLIAGILIVCSVSSVAAANCLGDEMDNGWCWPTGTSNIGGYLKWHEVNPYYSNPPGTVHLAIDINANDGDNVYAIANGTVTHARNDVSGYGGVGQSGGGIIIRHKDSSQSEFDSLYAHMKNLEVSAGDQVTKGQKIGEIILYSGGQDHLHFGIRFPANDDSNRWAGYGTWDKGFTDPINFLQTHSPKISTYTICNQPSCNIDSQTFSNGDKVGWYPQGYCNQASKWFTIVEKGGYEGYEPGIELELGDVCICR